MGSAAAGLDRPPAKGVTRHQLAQAVGISYASLRRLEKEKALNAPLWWYRNCARVALDAGGASSGPVVWLEEQQRRPC